MSTPVGPYAPVVRAGDWLICSGQLGLEAGGALAAGGVGAQTTQALANASAVLAEHGAILDDVVKTLVFLADIGGYPAMNEAYLVAFGDHRPARSAVAVGALPRAAEVEIECWAFKPQ